MHPPLQQQQSRKGQQPRQVLAPAAAASQPTDAGTDARADDDGGARRGARSTGRGARRARVLARRAAAAPLPVLSATKCVVALLVVSETDLMAVVDRRLQQTAAVRDGRAAVIFVADRHDHALNKTRLDTTRLRYVENADMAAVAGTDVSEYATEAPRLREIADCGDIRIRSHAVRADDAAQVLAGPRDGGVLGRAAVGAAGRVRPARRARRDVVS